MRDRLLVVALVVLAVGAYWFMLDVFWGSHG
jgi:hypothetical protein